MTRVEKEVGGGHFFSSDLGRSTFFHVMGLNDEEKKNMENV